MMLVMKSLSDEGKTSKYWKGEVDREKNEGKENEEQEEHGQY